ncbi:MAG: hypothetical protein ACI4RU_04015 [Acutalibacteraceae bacterium]
MKSPEEKVILFSLITAQEIDITLVQFVIFHFGKREYQFILLNQSHYHYAKNVNIAIAQVIVLSALSVLRRVVNALLSKQVSLANISKGGKKQ